jgi:hypothetical protein
VRIAIKNMMELMVLEDFVQLSVQEDLVLKLKEKRLMRE